MLSILCAQVSLSTNRLQAAKFGYLFGFGFFLSTLYWVSFALNVYIEQFWWAIPFALFGLPAFLAFFISAHSAVSWQFRKNYFYHFLFCCSYLFFEWLISWAFTGLPWGLLGYALSISDIMIQSASIFGILGLSFAAIYIGSSLFSRKMLIVRVVAALIICIIMMIFGYNHLQQNPTQYSEIKIRVVQPSIPQIAKWDPEIFWKNLDEHISLSQKPGDPDIIVWSEAALTVPYYYPPIHKELMSSFTKNNQVLLSGGVNDNSKNETDKDYEVYSSLLALNNDGKLLFDYHKSHLVPFGEYMPLANYIPLKKLAPGLLDSTPGTRSIVYLKPFNLHIHPLICYESIFADEVRISNLNADIMINITNDAWYGHSSGPYQHFEISRMRAIENGLPLIRAANNGISAIIDPLGRVLQRLELNQINLLDSYMPLKSSLPTIYAELGYLSLACWVAIILILQSLIAFVVLKIQ